jgi:hypothetical protein
VRSDRNDAHFLFVCFSFWLQASLAGSEFRVLLGTKNTRWCLVVCSFAPFVLWIIFGYLWRSLYPLSCSTRRQTVHSCCITKSLSIISAVFIAKKYQCCIWIPSRLLQMSKVEKYGRVWILNHGFCHESMGGSVVLFSSVSSFCKRALFSC